MRTKLPLDAMRSRPLFVPNLTLMQDAANDQFEPRTTVIVLVRVLFFSFNQKVLLGLERVVRFLAFHAKNT